MGYILNYLPQNSSMKDSKIIKYFDYNGRLLNSFTRNDIINHTTTWYTQLQQPTTITKPIETTGCTPYWAVSTESVLLEYCDSGEYPLYNGPLYPIENDTTIKFTAVSNQAYQLNLEHIGKCNLKFSPSVGNPSGISTTTTFISTEFFPTQTGSKYLSSLSINSGYNTVTFTCCSSGYDGPSGSWPPEYYIDLPEGCNNITLKEGNDNEKRKESSFKFRPNVNITYTLKFESSKNRGNLSSDAYLIGSCENKTYITTSIGSYELPPTTGWSQDTFTFVAPSAGNYSVSLISPPYRKSRIYTVPDSGAGQIIVENNDQVSLSIDWGDGTSTSTTNASISHNYNSLPSYIMVSTNDRYYDEVIISAIVKIGSFTRVLFNNVSQIRFSNNKYYNKRNMCFYKTESSSITIAYNSDSTIIIDYGDGKIDWLDSSSGEYEYEYEASGKHIIKTYSDDDDYSVTIDKEGPIELPPPSNNLIDIIEIEDFVNYVYSTIPGYTIENEDTGEYEYTDDDGTIHINENYFIVHYLTDEYAFLNFVQNNLKIPLDVDIVRDFEYSNFLKYVSQKPSSHLIFNPPPLTNNSSPDFTPKDNIPYINYSNSVIDSGFLQITEDANNIIEYPNEQGETITISGNNITFTSKINSPWTYTCSDIPTQQNAGNKIIFTKEPDGFTYYTEADYINQFLNTEEKIISKVEEYGAIITNYLPKCMFDFVSLKFGSNIFGTNEFNKNTITDIYCGTNLQKIGGFQNCQNLTTFIFPTDGFGLSDPYWVIEIEDDALAYCRSIPVLFLPPNYNEYNGLCQYCTSLSIIGQSYIYLGKDILKGCAKLNMKMIGEPDGTYDYPEGSLSYCTNLRDLILLPSCDSIIHPYAFAGTPISILKFRESPTQEDGFEGYIAAKAFKNCNNIRQISFNDDLYAPYMAKDSEGNGPFDFSNYDHTVQIYYPETAESKYNAARNDPNQAWPSINVDYRPMVL